MTVLDQLLTDREDRAREVREADERWLREGAGIDPAERLLSWDRWLVALLARTLQWPAEAGARERLMRQCAAEITVLAKQLRGRGWLLDGRALAGHVQAVLEPIAKAQQAGKVGDFWPYFRASVGRYVGSHAEESAAHARRTGANEGVQAIGALLGGLAVLRQASMTELLSDRAGEIAAAKKETLRDPVRGVAVGRGSARGHGCHHAVVDLDQSGRIGCGHELGGGADGVTHIVIAGHEQKLGRGALRGAQRKPAQVTRLKLAPRLGRTLYPDRVEFLPAGQVARDGDEVDGAERLTRAQAAVLGQFDRRQRIDSFHGRRIDRP